MTLWVGDDADTRYRARRYSSPLGVLIKSVTLPIVSRSPLTLYPLVSHDFQASNKTCVPCVTTAVGLTDYTDNVSRCQQLMHDFRKENYIKAWKEDVLQLYNVMW